jgi:DNA-directed RNA polymerase sigma subunit (sigma70/sigma32)
MVESLSSKRKRKSQAKPPHLLRYRRGIAGDHSQRDQAICARRAAGITLEKIGVEFGLSRERVSQIVRKEERRLQRAERLAPLRAAFAEGRSITGT